MPCIIGALFAYRWATIAHRRESMSTTTRRGDVSQIQTHTVAERIERLPRARWQVKARLVIGVATFFDACGALTVAYGMPVLAPMWGLSPTQIALAISIGFFGQLI